MSDAFDGFLDAWHRIVAARDTAAIAPLLADDVSVGAPPYWNRLEGRDLVAHLLGLILETIDGFTYHREWRMGGELALEFTGQVDGLDLQGIDLISLVARPDGVRVQRLDVMIRPINAVSALRDTISPRMTAYLAERAPQAEGAAGTQ